MTKKCGVIFGVWQSDGGERLSSPLKHLFNITKWQSSPQCYKTPPHCCHCFLPDKMFDSVPRPFAWLLSELVLLSALILSVMTSDRHHFILHYPVDTAASGATLLSLPASKSQAGWSPLLRDVYHTITLSGEGPTVTLGLMELLKPWRCKLWQIQCQEVTIINRRDKKKKRK